MKSIKILWKNGGYSLYPSITRAKGTIRALRPCVNFLEVDGVRQRPEYLERFLSKPSDISLGFDILSGWDFVPTTKETFEGVNTLKGVEIAIFGVRPEDEPYTIV